MIDLPDYSSTSRLLISQALKSWNTNALISLLSDEDYIVRTAAARELQTRGEEVIFNKLIHLINDPRSYVREVVAFILGQLGTPERPFKKQSIPLLKKMLSDSDAEVRAAAVCAFGHLFSQDMPMSVEKQLVSMVDDDSEDVRACLAFALGSSSGSRSVLSVFECLKNDDCAEVQSWAKTGLEILNESGATKQ